MVSSPKAPNSYQQASADQQAQTSSAYASSILNNPDESSNYGSVNYNVDHWEQVPGADGKMQYVPRYTRTTKFSPDEQRIAGYDTATRGNLGRTAVQQSAKIGDYLNHGLDTKDWQPWEAGHDFNESTDRPAIEQAMLGRYRDQAGKQNAAQDVQLSLRGMNPGSQGYSDVSDARNRSDVDAQQQAYLASGNEARQNYATAASHWDQKNQLRQAQEQSSYAQRNQPINEIMALMGGSQVNMPNFAPFSRQGIASSSPGQYANQNYQNQLQMANATNQGLFSLGGSVLGGIGQAGGFKPFTGMG
jgi:hypothetical protein